MRTVEHQTCHVLGDHDKGQEDGRAPSGFTMSSRHRMSSEIRETQEASMAFSSRFGVWGWRRQCARLPSPTSDHGMFFDLDQRARSPGWVRREIPKLAHAPDAGDHRRAGRDFVDLGAGPSMAEAATGRRVRQLSNDHRSPNRPAVADHILDQPLGWPASRPWRGRAACRTPAGRGDRSAGRPIRRR